MAARHAPDLTRARRALPGASRAIALVALPLLGGLGCAHPAARSEPPEATARAYAAALRAGNRDEVSRLTSRQARPALEAAGALPVDRVDAATLIDRSSHTVPLHGEIPGSRPVVLVREDGGFRLDAVPFLDGRATVDEAVTAFLERLDRREAEAMLLLLGPERRDALLREIGERTESLRNKRGSTETAGRRARVRVGDSYWLVLEQAGVGWRVVGVE